MGQTFFWRKKSWKILWNVNGRKIKFTFWYHRCYYQTLRWSVLRYKDLIVSEFFFYFWYHHYKFYPKLLSYQIQLKVVYLSPKFIGVLSIYLVGKKFCLFVIYSRDLDFRGGMTLKKKQVQTWMKEVKKRYADEFLIRKILKNSEFFSTLPFLTIFTWLCRLISSP